MTCFKNISVLLTLELMFVCHLHPVQYMRSRLELIRDFGMFVGTCRGAQTHTNTRTRASMVRCRCAPVSCQRGGRKKDARTPCIWLLFAQNNGLCGRQYQWHLFVCTRVSAAGPSCSHDWANQLLHGQLKRMRAPHTRNVLCLELLSSPGIDIRCSQICM